MTNNKEDDDDLVLSAAAQAALAEFLAEREEILRHKWIESEKAGHDIGFERALLDWIVKYRSAWRDERSKQQPKAA